MKRLPFFLFVTALSACALYALERQQIERNWEWKREQAEEWKFTENTLRLRTQPDRIWGGTGSRNLLVARAPITGTAEAFADLELVDAVNQYEQVGLLVYEHDDAFVKLILEHIDGLHYVVMAWESEQGGKVIAKVEIPASRVELRFRVEGESVEGFWRLPGEKDWNKAAECESPAKNDPRFALFTQDGPREEIRWAVVRKLLWQPVVE